MSYPYALQNLSLLQYSNRRNYSSQRQHPIEIPVVKLWGYFPYGFGFLENPKRQFRIPRQNPFSTSQMSFFIREFNLEIDKDDQLLHG